MRAAIRHIRVLQSEVFIRVQGSCRVGGVELRVSINRRLWLFSGLAVWVYVAEGKNVILVLGLVRAWV